MGVIMAIYVAKHPFWTEVDGKSVLIRRGTTVRDGHPLLGHKDNFEPLKVDYDVPRDESSGKHSSKKSE
jgi:hypothetical protein